MLVAYLSITGNCKRFVDNFDVESIEINPANPLVNVNEDYIVISPTYEYEITESINEFVEYNDNLKHFKGVVGSGNYNFNDLYIFTAKDLSEKYKVPILHDFEYFGTDRDVEIVKEVLDKLAITRTEQ
ncbi:class Ib ribonucleoside-diphosphate reductase assembly flavoprotein NrdI [Aquibacillus saliphilus]|uniref:class Ib ribonucleoside-diphosphate reductase assembly flavoprotein NrdI n=1 Tax=Aquibacillus saliphilus TaxID=1909422 RepID=UPI001CEFBA07|nr:class Ib ribonucleoside-diphosphate reductase assembly flavoprotein NrdI [Aquibacillus saliphilus]